MNKIKFLTLFLLFQTKTWFFDESNFSVTSDRQIILKGLQKTEKKIQESKSILNTVLTISIGISSITTLLLYYATNNNYVIKQLEKENPIMQTEEIKTHVRIGFFLNLMITGILIYLLYIYNQSQESIEESIGKITSQNFII